MNSGLGVAKFGFGTLSTVVFGVVNLGFDNLNEGLRIIRKGKFSGGGGGGVALTKMGPGVAKLILPVVKRGFDVTNEGFRKGTASGFPMVVTCNVFAAVKCGAGVMITEAGRVVCAWASIVPKNIAAAVFPR